MQVAMKTGTYSVMHMAIAFVVAWALSGNWKLAASISLIEPMVQTVAYFFHERFWTTRQVRENRHA